MSVGKQISGALLTVPQISVAVMEDRRTGWLTVSKAAERSRDRDRGEGDLLSRIFSFQA